MGFLGFSGLLAAFTVASGLLRAVGFVRCAFGGFSGRLGFQKLLRIYRDVKSFRFVVVGLGVCLCRVQGTYGL